MERPKRTIEPAEDCYDYELSQTQADFIALADAILEHRDPDYRLTYVDMVVEGDVDAIYTNIAASRIGSVLTRADEQLAIPSNGEHYPVLDLRKDHSALVGVSIRAWGWDYDKIRYTDTDRTEITYPRPYKIYEDSSDVARQMDVTFHYDCDGHMFSESICMYGSSMAPDNITVRNNVWIADYAETGYEGNGKNEANPLTDEAIYEYLDTVALLLGDAPLSFAEQDERRARELVELFAATGYATEVSRIIDSSWPAQAVYELTVRRYEELGSVTLVDALLGNDGNQQVAASILESRVNEYEDWWAASEALHVDDSLLG